MLAKHPSTILCGHRGWGVETGGWSPLGMADTLLADMLRHASWNRWTTCTCNIRRKVSPKESPEWLSEWYLPHSSDVILEQEEDEWLLLSRSFAVGLWAYAYGVRCEQCAFGRPILMPGWSNSVTKILCFLHVLSTTFQGKGCCALTHASSTFCTIWYLVVFWHSPSCARPESCCHEK